MRTSADGIDLEQVAGTIPSQGGREIGRVLRSAAAEVREGRTIVELGGWLGAGTAQLALGVRDSGRQIPIHVFDRFKATRGEVGKAARAGVRLRRGQNTLPLFADHLAPFEIDLRLHRGSLFDRGWIGEPIGLYVDDAAKSPGLFHHALRSFGPSWVVGETVVVLMDHDFWQNLPPGSKADALRVQQEFTTTHADALETISEADAAGTPTRFYRYIAPIDFSQLPEPVPRRRPPIERARLFFRRLGKRIR